MTKLRQCDHTDTAPFITFSCYRRCPMLADPAAAVRTIHAVHESVSQGLTRTQTRYPTKNGAPGGFTFLRLMPSTL